jgi:putative membrane-bound dehydrogenase-like protein
LRSICAAVALSVATAFATVPSHAADRYPNVPKPTVPKEFDVRIFAAAPDIFSPASMAVSPNGDVYIGEDPYNTSDKREMGLGKVMLCRDTNGDGQADTFTTFATNLCAPQGMCFVGGTLYVTNAPNLTALRDIDGDGVADTREELIKDFGPIPQGLVHHIPSGVRMGIDGFLYVSVGDKGIVKATGTDGRTIQLHGGGVVRVRPDGTMLEVYSVGERNIFDVSISPLMDVFTRDNTNDGDGWWSRVAHIQRNANYGYPSFYVNFADEMIPAIADYGSGSATGSLFVQEPRWPAPWNNALYTLDWAKGFLYRHDLKAKGATYEINSTDFIKGNAPTDVDMDGRARLYFCDWDRKSWGNSDAKGIISVVTPKNLAPQPAMPKLADADAMQLLTWLVSPSSVWRINASREIIYRGGGPQYAIGLRSILEHSPSLEARVAALYTLKEVEGEKANDEIAKLVSDPAMREHAIRALSNRDDQIASVDPRIFVNATKDPNPRVREQAAVALGRIPSPRVAGELARRSSTSEDTASKLATRLSSSKSGYTQTDSASALVPLMADPDVMIHHAALRSLQRIGGSDACIAALKPETPAPLAKGVLLVMRGLYNTRVIDALHAYIPAVKDPALQAEAMKSLARLYQMEAKWDGSWWETRPDTHGPYYKADSWAESNRVAGYLGEFVGSANPAIAKAAVTQIGFCRVTEAAPQLAKLANAPGPLQMDAARAIVQLKADDPAVGAAIEKIALDETLDPNLRGEAADALIRVKGVPGMELLLRVAQALDKQKNPPQRVIDTIANGVTMRKASEALDKMIELTKSEHQPIRAGAATSLVRSDKPEPKAAVEKMWKDNEPKQIDALLIALSRVKPEIGKPLLERIRPLLEEKRKETRQAAIVALAHLDDVQSIPTFVKLAGKYVDQNPALLALADLGPAKTPDDQIIPVTRAMVKGTSALASSDAKDVYNKVLNATNAFLADKRLPADEVGKLLAQIKISGVFYDYLTAGPIPVKGDSFAAEFAPDKAPAGPFATVSAEGKHYDWTKLAVTNSTGVAKLAMPDSSVQYFKATYDASEAGSAIITFGSDDGLTAWLNGAKILAKNIDRAVSVERDQVHVNLKQGTNTLLMKVNNHAADSGIFTRIRFRAAEFEPGELVAALGDKSIKPDVKAGRHLFEAQGCIKCHTTDADETPKAPYLGDAGAKYDRNYFVTSILRPSAQIAQGFATQKIVAQGDDGNDIEYVGFIVKEAADDVRLGDASGKVTVVPKSKIKSRTTLAESIMPTGLVDKLTVDDFASLVGYLESLKPQKPAQASAK